MQYSAHYTYYTTSSIMTLSVESDLTASSVCVSLLVNGCW